MDKLEALDIILHPMRPENFRGNKLVEAEKIVRKALTSPTSEEVCEALSESVKEKVIYNERDKMFGFINFDGEFYELVSLHLSGLDFDDIYNYKPHLLIMLGKFYEGVVENE